MAEDRIDSIIDLKATGAEVDALDEQLKQVLKLIKDVKAGGVAVSSATTPKQSSTAIKQLTIEQAKLNLQLAETNKQTKLNAQLESAIVGSRNQHRLIVKKLQQEVDNLNTTTEEGRKKEEELNKQINEQNVLIQKHIDLDRARIANIGNYNGQLGVLGKALRGIGGLGEAFAKSLGISPEAFGSIREAGTLIKEFRHTVEGEELFQHASTAAVHENTAARFANADASRLSAISTEANTVATEANAVATEAATKSTGFFANALNFLKGNPLILTLTALTAIGAAIAYFVLSADDGTKSAGELADEELRLAKSLSEANDALQDQVDILNDQFGSGIDLLKAQLSLLEKSGASSEKIFAKKKELAVAENSLNDEVLQAQIKRAENESINFDNSITGYDALNNSIEDHRNKYIEATNSIIDIENEKQDKLRLGAKEDSDTIKDLNKRLEAIKATADAEKKIFGQLYESAKKSFESMNALDELNAEHKKELSDEAQKREDANAKALFEILKIEQERRADIAKSIAKNEKTDYLDRLIALNDYGDAKKKIIEAQSNFELRNKKLTDKEIELIEAKRIDATLRLAKELTDILKINVDDFKKGATGIGIAITGMQKSMSDAIDAVKRKNEELRDELIKKNTEEIKAAVKSLLTEVQGLIFDIFTGDIDRQKNSIQEQIDLLEKQKEKSIETENQRVQSAEERAANITTIEARAAAQKEQLERRQRELDQQKARFQKAEAIANIISNTARGVTAALATIPPNPVLAAIVAAIGAVQLARVLAQPIPKYGKGTQRHKGGLMEVGDAGKSEAVVLPDGSIVKTPAKSTFMTAPEGTKVFEDYNKYMMTATRPPKFVVETKSDGTAQAVKQIGKDIVRAVKNQRQMNLYGEAPYKKIFRQGNSTINKL